LLPTFLFSIFGITFYVRDWGDFRLSVLNDLLCKIASILGPFSMGIRTPTSGGFFPGCQPIQKPWMSFVALGNVSFLSVGLILHIPPNIFSPGFEGFQLFFIFHTKAQRGVALLCPSVSPLSLTHSLSLFISPLHIVCSDE
jgi:hypothetical protein